MVIEAKEQKVTVRGREFTLRAMTGEGALDWVEYQILCARQTVEAQHIAAAGREEELRETLRQLFFANAILVIHALGCDAQFAEQLSLGERIEILAVQDELNRTANLLPFLAIQEQVAAIHVRDYGVKQA